MLFRSPSVDCVRVKESVKRVSFDCEQILSAVIAGSLSALVADTNQI